MAVCVSRNPPQQINDLWCVLLGKKDDPVRAAWAMLHKLAAKFAIEPHDPREADVWVHVIHTNSRQTPGKERTLPSRHALDPRADIGDNVSRVCVFVFFAYARTPTLVLCGTVQVSQLRVDDFVVDPGALARTSRRHQLILWTGKRYCAPCRRVSPALFTVVSMSGLLGRTRILQYVKWRVNILMDLHLMVHGKPLSEPQRREACRMWHRRVFEPYTEQLYTKDMRSYIMTRMIVGFMDDCPWYLDAENLLLEIRMTMNCWSFEEWKTSVCDAITQTPFQLLGMDPAPMQPRPFFEPGVSYHKLSLLAQTSDDAGMRTLRAASINRVRGGCYYAPAAAVWAWFYDRFPGLREATPFELLGIDQEAPVHSTCAHCCDSGGPACRYFVVHIDASNRSVKRLDRLLDTCTDTVCSTLPAVDTSSGYFYASGAVLWTWFRTCFVSGFQTDAMTTELKRRRAYTEAVNGRKVLHEPLETMHPPKIVHWFRVPFEAVAALVGQRKAVLHRGSAYIPWFFMDHVFRYNQRREIEAVWARDCTPATLAHINTAVCEADGQWLKKMAMLVARRFRKERAYIKRTTRTYNLPAIPEVVRVMAPCMRSIGKTFQARGHLPYQLRFPYLSSLYRLGYDREEVEEYWVDFRDKSRPKLWKGENTRKNIYAWAEDAKKHSTTGADGKSRFGFGCAAMSDHCPFTAAAEGGDQVLHRASKLTQLYDIEDLVTTTTVLTGAPQQKCAQFCSVMHPGIHGLDEIFNPQGFVTEPRRRKAAHKAARKKSMNV